MNTFFFRVYPALIVTVSVSLLMSAAAQPLPRPGDIESPGILRPGSPAPTGPTGPDSSPPQPLGEPAATPPAQPGPSTFPDSQLPADVPNPSFVLPGTTLVETAPPESASPSGVGPITLLQGTTRFIRDESARPITLEEALTLSDRLNLNLKIAQTDQRRDRWRFYNSLAQFVPDVTPLFYERRRIDGTFFVGGAFPVDVDITTHTVGATFRAQVFNGFRNVLESATRQSTLQASRADVRRTQADVLLDTYTLYQQLLLAKAEVAIAEDAVAQARSTLGLNQARFQAGTAPRLDVLQSEAELAQEVQRLLAAQNNYRTQSATLSEVLGIPILTDLVPVETTVLPKTLLDDTVSLQDLTALALANRPEIQRERYRVQANRINQWSAFSDVLPDVIFSNTSQAQGQTLDYMPNSQIRQFQLNWNLPQSGASAVTQFQVLRAETERARLVQQQTERQVTREVNERYFTAQSQKSQIEAFRLRLRSTDEAFRLSRLRLEAGLITTTDLLINQVNRNRAQLDLARTILDYNISQARLIHGIGLMSKQTLLTSTPLCPTPPPTGRPAPKAPPLPTQNPVTPAPLPPQP